MDGGPNTLSEEYRRRSEDIIKRLDNLSTTQWIPFVLYLYDNVTQRAGKSEFFYEVMKTIETITFRVSITDLNATVIDDTYIESCSAFENRIEDPDEDNPYDAEEVSKILLGNVPDKRQLSGDTFAELLIRERGWSNTKAKQLFLKVVDEEFAADSTWTQKGISEDANIDVEHIFPSGFIRNDGSNPYSLLHDFFNVDGELIDATGANIYELVEELESIDAADVSEGDQEYDRVERIKQHIETMFVDDLGNMMILIGSLNRSVQNKRFAIKMKEYHAEHPDDLDNPINEYFSVGHSGITQDNIDDLEDLSVPDGYDDTDPSLGAIEQDMNEWWNLDRFIKRKVDIVRAILESLTYSTGEDEHRTEFEDVYDDLEETVAEEINKRASQVV